MLTIYFRSPLTKVNAEKSRDNLAKDLYEQLFREIMQHINHQFSYPLSDYSVGILDIAGFGKSIVLFCSVTINSELWFNFKSEPTPGLYAFKNKHFNFCFD